MSKKVINLGKVKGRTLDLKVEDKIIKKKYDDETEWQDVAELTGGVDVVDNADELPSDASENDIVFVENEVFSETIELQEEIPIVLTGGEQRLNVEFKQDAKFIHETNLEELCPDVNNEDVIISYEYGMTQSDSDIELTYFYYPPALVSANTGFNQSLNAYVIGHYKEDALIQYYKFRGLSVKDFITSILGFSITEEQLQVLLGEHYADKSEDNPSYDWVKLIVSEEPLGDNSVFFEDDEAYFTIEYDAVVDIKGLLVLDYFNFMVQEITDDEHIEELFYINGYLYDSDEYEEEEFNEILKYGNAIANIFLSGGMKDVSYDVYKQKGFHIYEDGKWTSLEEKMNIPKIVDIYSDLPKSFTENGLMVVANEEKSLPEPTSEINAGAQGLVAIKPTFSVAEEMDRIKQLAIENGAPEDLDWENGEGVLEFGFYNSDECYIYAGLGSMFDNGAKGVMLCKPVDSNNELEEVWLYSDEPGIEIELYNQDTGSYEIFTTSEGGCWYYYVYQQVDKEEILITPPTKYEGTEPFFMSDKPYMCGEFWVGYYSDDFEFDAELSSFTLGFIDFYDFSKTQIYPKGFYKYADNRWCHQPEIGGGNLDNSEVLKQITEEDIGNLHGHDNQSTLDEIDDYFFNRLCTAASQTHYHSNLDTLNSINSKNATIINSLGKYHDDQGHYFLTSDGRVVNAVYHVYTDKRFTEEQILYPQFFQTYVPQEGTNTLTIQLHCPTDHPINSAMFAMEFMFAIDTRQANYNIILDCGLDSSCSALRNAKLEWLGEVPTILEPNKYYEFSIFNFKGIWVCSEVSEVL